MNKQMLKRPMIFMLAFVMLSMTACDEEGGVTPGEESESAYLIGARVRTPDGDVDYLGAYPEMPSDIDPANMVEFGSRVTMKAFGENVYVWNSNAATMTKYGVKGDLSIEVQGIMSFASTGLANSFEGDPIVFSETQAYFFALAEGKIVVWNPSEMLITETINVDPLVFPESPDWYGVWNNYILGDKIILPVSHGPWENLDIIKEEARVAIFDPASKTLTYDTDDRMLAGDTRTARNLANVNEHWHYPYNSVGYAVTYGNYNGSATQGGLIKFNADGTFDDDSFVDLKDILPAESVRTVYFVSGNKAAVSYHAESGTTSAPENPDNYWGHDQSVALVDMENGTYEPYTGLDEVGLSAGAYTGSDLSGTMYFGGSTDGWNTTHIYTINSNAEAEKVFTTGNLNGGYISLIHQAR